MGETWESFIGEQILICEALIAEIEKRRPELLREDYSPTAADAEDIQRLRVLRASREGLLHLVSQKMMSSRQQIG